MYKPRHQTAVRSGCGCGATGFSIGSMGRSSYPHSAGMARMCLVLTELRQPREHIEEQAQSRLSKPWTSKASDDVSALALGDAHGVAQHERVIEGERQASPAVDPFDGRGVVAGLGIGAADAREEDRRDGVAARVAL